MKQLALIALLAVYLPQYTECAETGLIEDYVDISQKDHLWVTTDGVEDDHHHGHEGLPRLIPEHKLAEAENRPEPTILHISMAEVLKFYEIEPVDVEALAERHRVEKGLAQLESEELAERLRV